MSEFKDVKTDSKEPTVETMISGFIAVQVGPQGTLPAKGSAGAAGYDLYASASLIIKAGERGLVPTQVSMAIPAGYYGRIAPRSGLAWKNGLDVFAGVIDSDYRGDIGVILFNSDKKNDFNVQRGDRVAQIIFERCDPMQFVVVPTRNQLPSTARGDGGFGSTGL